MKSNIFGFGSIFGSLAGLSPYASFAVTPLVETEARRQEPRRPATEIGTPDAERQV
ncbi:MAG: hypothetical protein O7A65_03980 [Proteobacteria bacterium]|nr:hypothetical protein [Pseudomonadota bacterium]